MTDTPAPEAGPVKLSPAEIAARTAAEAATRELPDLIARLTALEGAVAQLTATLTAAAGPDGNGARLTARLNEQGAAIAALTDNPPVHPELQRVVDNLRQAVANLERTPR